MNNNNFFQSKNFKKIIYGFGVALAVILVFQAGMFVGYKKASFSYRWGDNYHRAFGVHREGERMMGGMMNGFFRGKDFTNSSGAIGKIININLPALVIESADGIEKIIIVANDTVIRQFRETVKAIDLKIGDFIVAIGSPNDSAQIEAKIIRIMPDPENFIGVGGSFNIKK